MKKIVSAEFQSIYSNKWIRSQFDISKTDPVKHQLESNAKGYEGGTLRYRYVYSDGSRGPIVEPLRQGES